MRVSMQAFVCVHARVREGVCVSPSGRLSVRVDVRASNCLIVHACVQQCIHSVGCMRACVRAYVSVRPTVRPFVCLSVCLSACMFVRLNVCSHMRAFINACAIFLISNF